MDSLLRPALALALLCTLAALAGCGDPHREQGPLEIIGTYTDEFGGDHQITASTWTSFGGTSVIHILFYDNVSEYLIGRNDDVLSFDPGRYARQDWIRSNGNLYYCSTVFDGISVDAALAGRVDRVNPAAGGCDATHNFPWTRLAP